MQATPPRHYPWLPVMLLALILPLILLVFYFQVAANSFQMFGLTPTQASWLLIASLFGGMINIPITRRRVQLADPRLANMSPSRQMIATIFHYYPPATVDEVVAVNVGGAVVPVAFSVYLLVRYPYLIGLAVLGTILVAIVAKLLARPLPGVGIILPSFVPPVVAATLAFLLVRAFGSQMGIAAVAPVAYIAGTLGTLIGADLLNLPLVLRGGLLAAGPQRFWRPGPDVPVNPDKPRILSIGGAGVFDGVFLTGILAAFLVSVL